MKTNTSASAQREQSPRERMAEIGLGAAWLVGLAAALQILDALVGKSPLAAAIAGAVIVDIVAGRAGVRWELAPLGPRLGAARGQAPLRPQTPSTPPSPVRRTALGMATTLVAAVATLLLASLFGMARIEGGAASPSLAFAILRYGALGVRDELMFRGIVLMAASRARIPPLIAAAFAALAGGAAIALLPSASVGGVALAVTSGFFFALLWQRFHGAWAAIGAHAFWLFLIGSGLRGGVIDVAWTSGSLTAGGRSSGGVAYLAAAVFALLAALLLLDERRRRASPAPAPASAASAANDANE